MTDPARALSLFRAHLAPRKFVTREVLHEHPRTQDAEHIYYAPPCLVCGESGHCTTEARSCPGDATASVVHCWEHDQILLIKELDIMETILAEETKFQALLDKWEGKVPSSVTPEEAFRLHTSQGCPLEWLEDRCSDLAALRTLMEGHSNRSRGNKPKATIFRR